MSKVKKKKEQNPRETANKKARMCL